MEMEMEIEEDERWRWRRLKIWKRRWRRIRDFGDSYKTRLEF